MVTVIAVRSNEARRLLHVCTKTVDGEVLGDGVDVKLEGDGGADNEFLKSGRE